jgi:hypothetical protein
MQDFLLQGLSLKEEKIESLVRMGFPKDEAEMAVVRCGMFSSEVFPNVFLVMLINKIPISSLRVVIRFFLLFIWATNGILHFNHLISPTSLFQG